MPLSTRLRTPPSPPLLQLTHKVASSLQFLIRPNILWAYSVPRVSFQCKGFRLLSQARPDKPTADIGEAGEEKTVTATLKQKIEALGVNPDSCIPGNYDLVYCPKCGGGRSINRSLSFHISKNWTYAMWRCFHLECGWAGQVSEDAQKASRPLTVESVSLEVLDDELLKYFSERMISKETLQRNNVMQLAGNQKVIAFTYWQNGLLVGCKYRTLEKRFWQERNTEKVFYGLDDIAEADVIIIVEGELDKLSMEEAGYYNCVSVPSGAPHTVSLKELPSPEKDTTFPYLWNCKDYLDKASRVILATDGDLPGQALAEELARRLGRERCWRVHWPKKDDVESFKDANEVLKILGADAVRDAVDKAESCNVPTLV